MVELKNTELQAKFDEYGAFVLSGGYVYDEENKVAVKSCIEVLDKNEFGLLILGNTGSGKTLLFEMAQRIISPVAPNFFIKVSTLEVVLAFNDKEIGHKVYRRWTKDNVLFDDLGTEEQGFMYQKIEVMKDMIQHRYGLYRKTGVKTHFTTNLNREQMVERYGIRCTSRLDEMCIGIKLGASKQTHVDRRLLRNFKGLPLVKHSIPKTDGVDYEAYKENREKDIEKQKEEESMGLGQRLKIAMGVPSESIKDKMEEFKKQQGLQ